MDWVGRLYTVINPNITDDKLDLTTQFFEYDENGLNNNDIFVNKNGYSNIYTVSDIFIIRMIMSGEWTPNEQVLKHYDLNGDGLVDVSDLAILTAWVMGKGE